MQWSFLQSGAFSAWEQIALYGVLIVAVLGLLYAGFLTVEMLGQDTGTERLATRAVLSCPRYAAARHGQIASGETPG